jgi:hypothetical protein
MAAINNPSPIEGSVKPTSLEVEGFEPLLSAHRLTTIESNQQGRFDYLTGTTVIYAGYAPKGLATSVTSWLLQKFSYDSNNNVTLRQIAYDSWDNRSTASYS